MKKKNAKREIIFWVAIAVCAVAVLIIVPEVYRSMKSESDFDDLRELIKDETSTSYMIEDNTQDTSTDDEQATTEEATSETTTPAEETTTPVEETTVAPKVILEKYSELYALNNHLAGWLKIDGTVIDYPVLEVEGDNDYYLTHDFYGDENKHGQIIFDYRCDFENPSTNIILHGHHMADGSMFGGLKKYKKKSYYKEHKYIQFDTLYEEGTYEIFAVFLSKVYNKGDEVFKYYNFIQADSESDFNSFVENVKTQALYDTGVIPTYGDSFITLSTCEYSQENGRLVVVARKLSQEEAAMLSEE